MSGKKIQERSGFYYQKTDFDEDGWADANKYLPIPFDLVKIQCRNKKINGWWNSKDSKWEGLRLKEGDLIEKWQRLH